METPLKQTFAKLHREAKETTLTQNKSRGREIPLKFQPFNSYQMHQMSVNCKMPQSF